MNPNQCSDMANMGKSGGVNNQDGTLTVEEYEVASIAPASNIPPVGTSNGGK